ncbi:MAG: hypothetical protein K2L45_09510 [Muribaculaceae bacterium]|nr:hypothetical protein [Muribaculaceae bacterium]
MKIFIKNRIILILGFLYILSSCAQDGPYVSGKLECDIVAAFVTPNFAIVSATIPNKNIIEGFDHNMYLFDKPIDKINIDYDELIKWNDYNVLDSHLDCMFTNLKPNTTYYPLVEIYSSINGEIESGYDRGTQYSSGYSFTTTKEGDYSLLGEIQGEVMETSDEYTTVKITFPANINFRYGYLEASTSQDMTNVIESEYVYDRYKNTALFRFHRLPPNTYYLRLINVRFEFVVNGETYDFYDDDEITINIANTITIQ